MKKILLFLIAGLFVMACNSQKTDSDVSGGFQISGKIENADSLLYLSQFKDGELLTLDTAVVVNGVFTFSGKVDFPEMYYIAFGPREVFPFFIQNAEITIEGDRSDIENIKVTGSEPQDRYKTYSDGMKKYQGTQDSLEGAYVTAKQEGNEKLMQGIIDEYYSIKDKVDAYTKQFITDNSDCVVAPYLYFRTMAFQAEFAELDSMTNSFDAALEPSIYVQELKKRVEKLKLVQIGQKAPDFTMNDVNGNPVALSSLIGKNYLLVDFWAAWCRPCRGENPNVVAMYNKYKDKGFDVLGVSFDKGKEAWIQAIKDDGLTWTQVSDLKYWDNAAGKIYAISSIPSNVLLDKDGVIIAKNVRAEGLQEKLAEIFGE